MFKNIFFDFDGTLFDTVFPICEALNLTLKHFKISRNYDVKQTKRFIGKGSQILLKKALKNVNYKEEDIKNVLKFYIATQFKTHRKKCDPFNGIKETLKVLKAKKINLFIVTNKPRKILEPIIEKNLKNYFKEIISFDDVLTPKPSPEGCEYLIKKYRLKKEEIIFVGDSRVDQETAKNANLKFACCTYGYDDYSKIKIADKKFYINEPKELLKLF